MGIDILIVICLRRSETIIKSRSGFQELSPRLQKPVVAMRWLWVDSYNYSFLEAEAFFFIFTIQSNILIQTTTRKPLYKPIQDSFFPTISLISYVFSLDSSFAFLVSTLCSVLALLKTVRFVYFSLFQVKVTSNLIFSRIVFFCYLIIFSQESIFTAMLWFFFLYLFLPSWAWWVF